VKRKARAGLIWTIISGSPEAPLTTTTIGRYRILEKVGQGGMGVVYRAQDTLLERVVALKVISTSIEDNPELRERFFREARAAGQLSHRNVITIHDLGEHDGQPYLAMEFLTGEDLQHRLARQEPMSLRRKLEIASEICDGLCYAHRRGLIHRDVKPANIFITDEGVVKLLDFGLARMVASELTRSNMMMGTLNYMAPEQVRGERTDHRADIFSFGVVLYEMLSGRKAFRGIRSQRRSTRFCRTSLNPCSTSTRRCRPNSSGSWKRRSRSRATSDIRI
jgi:serine/threonine-protein kinase